MRRITLESAFVLHSRAYSNTSLIVELLTRQYGRVVVLARSARGMSSRYKGKLQAFVPMLVSWSGRGEMVCLSQVELNGAPYQLEGRALLCGFYLNELLIRLMQREDPHPVVFDAYRHALHQLEYSPAIGKTLRRFEKQLLDEIGYGLSLSTEADTGLAIDPKANYLFYPDRGFIRCHHPLEGQLTFSGSNLLAIANDELVDEFILNDAKKILRSALSVHLGDKPLKSRELF